mmetsp:Transcript_23365/g.43046  ORF Transcript_23365/g.43046 Transcript_23365/m.43046 type:complete len:147 (-) Transcript_23365:648-1088(-)
MHSSELGCDDIIALSRKSMFQGVASSATRFRKRVRADFTSHPDQAYLDALINLAKTDLLSRLKDEGTSPAFQSTLASFEECSKLKASSNKKRKLSAIQATTNTDIDGIRLTIPPPEYPSCLGTNSEGDSLFTLGRLWPLICMSHRI